jgi:hypothetical protein
MRANGFAWEHYRLKLNEHERVQNAEIGEYPYFCGIRRFVDCRDLVAA